MNIGGSDESEPVGVGAHPGLDFQSAPQRRPGVFGGVGRRDVHARQPRPFVGAEVREFVIGRQQRMGFGVALGLCDLHDWLPADAGSGVLAADGPSVRIHVLEHAPRTDVGIVRNRQESRADALARLFEPLPEVFRPLAVERGEGQELPGDVGAFAHEHHPVNGVGGREAAPLPADQARKNARFVVPVGDLDAALPCGADDGFEVDFLEGFVAVHGTGHLHEHQPFLAWIAAHLQQPPARRRVCHPLIAAEQRGGDAQVFGVIRDDEKVQRPFQLGSARRNRGGPQAFPWRNGRPRPDPRIDSAWCRSRRNRSCARAYRRSTPVCPVRTGSTRQTTTCRSISRLRESGNAVRDSSLQSHSLWINKI